METNPAILLAKALAKIQAYKKKIKTLMKDIQIPPQTVQLQGEIETLQHEVLDLKGRLVVLDVEKCKWEEEKQKMQKRIDELNDYITLKDRSPTTLAIRDMSEMSLKDLEITQFKEANQELKDMITAKESEDFADDIRTLNQKVRRYEERIIG